jgi:predicted RNA-binding protein with PUA-like domain
LILSKGTPFGKKVFPIKLYEEMIFMAYWLLKTEPEDYSFADLTKAGEDIWDGVRNAQAQKNLRAMKPGDLAFIYHTGKVKAIIGIAEITTSAIPDPGDNNYVAVKVRAKEGLPRAISLKETKALPQFAEWELVRLPRLSVMPVPPEIWQHILSLAQK